MEIPIYDVVESVRKYIKKKESSKNRSISLKRRWDSGEFKGTTGRAMSEEHKAIISNALKGKMPKNLSLINANKKGSGNPQWGKTTSAKQKEAARITCSKRDYSSKEFRRKISEANKGDKASNWKGGISPENKIIRKGLDFRLWRESVFERDNWTCQKCKTRGGALRPHHILNFAEHKELRFEINNGITLCEKDHKHFHKKYGLKGNNKEQLNEFLQQEIKEVNE